jgi:hypothetical protein
MVLDTRPQAPPASTALQRNQVVDVVDVCQEPSKIAVRTVSTTGANGQPRTATRVYVVCFLANEMMVVDPDRPGVLSTILLGVGPNEVAFADGGGVTPSSRAYVSTFSESTVGLPGVPNLAGTIGLVDLDPASPTSNRMIARLGSPAPRQ